jgi:hypothetical protein
MSQEIPIALGVVAGLAVLVAIYFLVLRPRCKSPAKPGLLSCYCPAGFNLQKDKVSCSAAAGSPGGPCLPGNKCTDSNALCQEGTCQPCGEAQGTCCANNPKCLNDTYACDETNKCVPCGVKGGPCCSADPKCHNEDTICKEGGCAPCGKQDTPCCDGKCSDGSLCDSQDSLCCGLSGAYCCSDEKCASATDKCDEGICQPPPPPSR